jgi:hypothetical protein
MRVRTIANGRFAFGVHQWGGPKIVVPFLAGAVVRAQRIRCLPSGGEFDFYAATPAYVEGLDGSLVVLDLVGDRLREDMLEGDGCREAWEAWFGAIGAVDVYQEPAVPGALQPVALSPYRSQRTTNATTTTPRKASPMSAKTTTPATAAATTVETRTKSAVSKDGTHKCAGCKTEKPITKYPTVRDAEGEYVRSLDECRACRDARRTAKKEAATTAA